MYNKIIVPLDGSPLAECVLPYVETIVKGCQAKEVSFIRVVEPFNPASTPEYPLSPSDLKRINAGNKAVAEEYLANVVGRIKAAGVKVNGEVIVQSSVAETIGDYAKQKQADLVVIATHGRSGVSRWVMGSVADRLLRSLCIPVLMVRAPGCLPGI